jgi:hypothetical protein
VAAQAERYDTKSAFGEEVQKVRIPAPCTLECAVHKQQRVWMLLAGLTLVDYFQHDVEFLSRH